VKDIKVNISQFLLIKSKLESHFAKEEVGLLLVERKLKFNGSEDFKTVQTLLSEFSPLNECLVSE
jgi:hypothetical protein